MTEENRLNGNFFFMDEGVTNVTSFNIGNIWLYFWKEVHIGTRDIVNDKGIFLKLDGKYEEDGYTHRHELTQANVSSAIEEAYGKDNVIMVNAEDLLNTTFQWIAAEIGSNIDKHLIRA